MTVARNPSPPRIGRLWEKGWIGSPTSLAAWTRGLLVAVCAVTVLAGVSVQWAHSTYAGALAFLDLVPVVAAVSLLMSVVLFWLHGTAGQTMLFLFAALLTAIMGGYALGNAVFTARGVVTTAVINDCAPHSDIRATWIGCTVRLPDGSVLSRPIRGDRERPGQRVTVTYDPAGLVAPAFGDRSGANPVVLGLTGTGLILTLTAITAATCTGERYRRRGQPSWPEQFAPHYYPRRRSSPDHGSRA